MVRELFRENEGRFSRKGKRSNANGKIHRHRMTFRRIGSLQSWRASCLCPAPPNFPDVIGIRSSPARITRIVRAFTNNNRGEAKPETRIDVLVDHVDNVPLSGSLLFRLTTSASSRHATALCHDAIATIIFDRHFELKRFFFFFVTSYDLLLSSAI